MKVSWVWFQAVSKCYQAICICECSCTVASMAQWLTLLTLDLLSLSPVMSSSCTGSRVRKVQSACRMSMVYINDLRFPFSYPEKFSGKKTQPDYYTFRVISLEPEANTGVYSLWLKRYLEHSLQLWDELNRRPVQWFIVVNPFTVTSNFLLNKIDCVLVLLRQTCVVHLCVLVLTERLREPSWVSYLISKWSCKTLFYVKFKIFRFVLFYM